MPFGAHGVPVTRVSSAGMLGLLLLGVGCATASSPQQARTAERPPSPVQQLPRTVAVLPLTGGVGMEGLGFALSEILARDLALVPRLRVVERARLDAVLREQGLGATGRVAPQSVPRAGQLVGAERLLTGVVSQAGTGASIDVSMLNVQSGITELVFSERLAMNGVIDAQERLAERAFQRLGVVLTPAERERLAKRPTRRVDALIAFGNGRRAEAMGNGTQARQYYAQAARLDPSFGAAADALSPTVAPVLSATPLATAPIARTAASSSRRPFDLLLDDLMLSITDRVVRPAALPAVCPPICPSLTSTTGTIIVRITP